MWESPSAVTLHHYHALIRQYLDFRAFEEGGLDVAARAMPLALRNTVFIWRFS